MLSSDTINALLGVEESFYAPHALMEIMGDKERREALFNSFLEHEKDLSYDWFLEYFQAEHADRNNKMQDFTPDSVATIAHRILGTTGANADLCAGTGGLTIKRWSDNKGARIYCEEFSDRAMPFLLFNLAIRNVEGYTCHGDTLTRKFKAVYKFTKGERYSDIAITDEAPEFSAKTVVMNPAYSMKWEPEKDWIEQRRFKDFGKLAPKGKADYAFLLTGLDMLDEGGTMAIILPHGVLFRSVAEGEIRKALIEQGLLHAVIGLPEKVFIATDIPTVIFVLKKGRAEDDILFIRAEDMYERDGAKNAIQSQHIGEIAELYHRRERVEKVSRLVDIEKVKENNFNLNIPRYIFISKEVPPVHLLDTKAEFEAWNAELAAARKELSGMLLNIVGCDEHNDRIIREYANFFAGVAGMSQKDMELAKLEYKKSMKKRDKEDDTQGAIPWE